MAFGSIVIQKDADGRTHQLALQNRNTSCGPAALRYVYKLVTGRELGEDYFRALVERAETNWDGAYRGSLGKGGAVMASGDHNWDGRGTLHDDLRAALGDLRPKINSVRGGKNLIGMSTRFKPAIATVRWIGSPLHYIVVAGRLNSVQNSFLVLDPWYGVQQLEQRNGQFTIYEPRENGQIVDGAGITDDVIKVL